MQMRGVGVASAVVAMAVLGVVAMSWFWKPKKPGAWDLASVEPPWGAGPSIHAHIAAHIAPGVKGLTDGGERLPDEKDDGGIRWVAGGLDGAFGHHAGGGAEKDRAKLVERALRVVLEDASPVKLKRLYDQLLQGSALDYIDPLIERLAARPLDAARLKQLAAWIATGSPDREPVKLAIALLGVTRASEHVDVVMTLGRHEELTLYAAVALTNLAGDDAEPRLFELARQVDGWGRIQIVERLAGTTDPDIKAWMVRDGFRNSVMDEYLAYACASAGDLRGELARDVVDAELLAGAGDIILALLNGGPAEDMDDYADGAVVAERYLHHLGAEPTELRQLIVADALRRFVEEERDWTRREEQGWTPALRERLRARAAAIRSLPRWKDAVAAGLRSEDDAAFWDAHQAARILDIDAWDRHFERLEAGKHDAWYHVMQTADAARVDRVVAFAEQRLPLDEIATGPADELGLGPAWQHHGHLDFVLQDLRRFPGKGWSLIRAGLRSPVVRNRNMALRALSAWDRASWPPDAQDLLERARRDEPRDDVRRSIDAVLAGRQLDDPRRRAE